ncbi:hypothetical protein GH714_003025 [Hevea brasiliensis]|uniref:Apple domain-containing protein n=1 Tax=Hevea brasiliensis TaxID=3981 RepID=A0A6A6KV42_HEVBR|nr:hypothetical protein GH714_003025 [Hevea brasiliensis]
MEVCLLCFLLLFFARAHCKSDIHLGYRVTLAVPVEYSGGFLGRAFLIETNQMKPNFRAALSVEPIDGKYSCSLEVFLGDVKVWNSGHYSPFFTSEKCVLELTKLGDLQLKGARERVGWRTGTSGQGVERLQILGNGNLVLVDALNLISGKASTFQLTTCSCIRFLTKENGMDSDCGDGISGGFCGRDEVEMLELNGVGSVLRAAPVKVNISKEACANFCLEDCKCVAALYSSGELRECYLYGAVMGVKQVERGTGSTYMVKVPKGTHVGHANSGLKNGF